MKMRIRSLGLAALLPVGLLASADAGATAFYRVCNTAGDVCTDTIAGSGVSVTLDQLSTTNSFIEIDSARISFAGSAPAGGEAIRVRLIDQPGLTGFGVQLSLVDSAVNPWAAASSASVGAQSRFSSLGFGVSGVSVGSYTFIAGFTEGWTGAVPSGIDSHDVRLLGGDASVTLNLFSATRLDIPAERIRCLEIRQGNGTSECTGAAVHGVNLSPDLLVPFSGELDFSSSINPVLGAGHVGADLVSIAFNPTPMSEPSMLALLGLAYGAASLSRRRKAV